jgi:hypothetical protein
MARPADPADVELVSQQIQEQMHVLWIVNLAEHPTFQQSHYNML